MSARTGSMETVANSPGLEPSRPMAPLLARFQAVRKMTEGLARPLSPEDCQIQSMPDASPVKWHLAHTTWFFETFVLAPPHVTGFQMFHPSFNYLFNSYYNAVGDRLPRPRARTDHPAHSRGSLRLSRGHRSRAMENFLLSAGESGCRPALRTNVIELGLNHEQQHQELILTDIKHAAGTEPATARLPRRGGKSVSPKLGRLAGRSSREESNGSGTRARASRLTTNLRAPPRLL